MSLSGRGMYCKVKLLRGERAKEELRYPRTTCWTKKRNGNGLQIRWLAKVKTPTGQSKSQNISPATGSTLICATESSRPQGKSGLLKIKHEMQHFVPLKFRISVTSNVYTSWRRMRELIIHRKTPAYMQQTVSLSSYCSRARATSRNPAAEVLLRSHVTLLQGIHNQLWKKHQRKRIAPPSPQHFLHLRVVLICRALLSILAPMSSMLFPLRSTFLRQVLLPKALTSTVPRERRRESDRDSDCRAWGGQW